MTIGEVGICNLALAKIGHEGFISSFTEDSKGARYMNVFYEPMRDVVLRSHLWRFARVRAILAPLSSTPAFDASYQFQYPDDCLRVIGTDQDYRYKSGLWKVENGKILANTNVLNIIYIKRVTDTSLFDPMFIDVLAAKLAYEAALPITKSQEIKEQMKSEYNASVIRAAHASATEQDGDKFISELFIQSR